MILMKKKERERVGPVFLLLILSLLLIGCTPNPIIIERNITINRTITNTIYITNTTIEPCNVTEPEIDTTIYDRQYVLGLIRQLKHYEEQQDLYFNDSECSWKLNQSNIRREKAEEELCDNHNSSWC